METSLHNFLVSIPIAIVLWALMLLAVAVAVVLTGRPRTRATAVSATASASATVRRRTGRPWVPAARAARPAVDRVVADRVVADRVVADRVGADPVADDLRFADEVTVAAEHAAITAARARAGWEDAQQELEVAWAAYQEADAAARRTWAATSYPLMSRRRKLGENADRERYLHRAATVACRERELSIAQLNDVLAHRGWNPRLHPVVQEALLRNAIREHRFAAYRQAQRRERVTWQHAEIAAEALRALRAEAASAFSRSAAEPRAVNEFWWAEPWTTSELPVAA